MGREAGEGGHRRVARSSGLADAALADGEGGMGLRRGAPDSNGVVGLERAVDFSSGRQPIALVTWRCGGGGGARAAARAAARRSDSGVWRLRTEARGHGAGRSVRHGHLYGAVRQQCRPGQPIRVRGAVAWPLTGGPHMSANFKFQKKTRKFPPSQEK
jgi:hypothetical protein